MLIMDEIKEFEFNERGLQKLKELSKGKNWPVIYLIHDDSTLYIGETTSAAARMSQPFEKRREEKFESHGGRF